MMRHFNKKTIHFSFIAAKCQCDFLRLCLISCAVAVSLISAACTSLPVGDQSQMELIETIRNPRRTDFQTVLARTQDLNFVDKNGRTPLYYAIERNNAAQIRALLQYGADPALPDFKGYTAIHHAAVIPGGESLKVMLEAGVPPDAPGSSRIQEKTPLMEAARIGEIQNVELLLKYGADLKSRDDRGRTPLMFAAVAPKYAVRLVKLMLDKGAPRFQADKKGNTALFMAIDAKNQAAALYLLSLLPDFDKNDDYTLAGLAAMKHAIDSGNIDIIKAILAKKLPLNIDLSMVYKSLKFATVEGWYEILAENGVINDGKTPLFWAAQNDNVKIINLLLKHGADPTAKDHTGAYPSEYTRQRESNRILEKAAKERRDEQLRKLEEKNRF